ncbi:MAG: anthranilate phosphoribosyltransferase [Melioribacteraceae bacterium]|nr:anthranilate phosphoribosyltransferase [Melioribacteraceae bacterium]MCF8354201.1 anthranilate phosphoribosyltransferase [Melioribacteraceae bacterium]MCF8392847.1 anthranilate phosphoribosyltransferase [Melioribacteraceae bacterium]MCF8418667.1 anthranilate phosphoribosyltransferase [Melioribacteraceae bacterium]
MKEQLEKVINGINLTFDESYNVMYSIMSGNENNSKIASLLTALKMKGESSEEVAGFVKAMREKVIPIKCDDERVIDVCGTGGDGSGTFNISTAVSFVAAGSGVKVAKHGNRSISSKSGSSDVLHELGVDVQLSPGLSERALNEIGIAFLFAPLYHPAMAHVAPIRKELEFRSIFNILGPLTNPARTRKQLIGTFNENTAKLMSEAVKLLEMDKVCFICTENRYDEITLTNTSNVIETINHNSMYLYQLTHEDFGFPKLNLSQLQGGSAKENAEIINSIFNEKEKNAPYYVVAANAALALKVSGISDDLNECREIAEESIQSGKTLQKLKELKEFGDKHK